MQWESQSVLEQPPAKQRSERPSTSPQPFRNRRHNVAPGGVIAREPRLEHMYRWQKHAGQGEAAACKVSSYAGSEVNSVFSESNVTRAKVGGGGAVFGTERRESNSRIHLGGKPTSSMPRMADRTRVHSYIGHTTWGAAPPGSDDYISPKERAAAYAEEVAARRPPVRRNSGCSQRSDAKTCQRTMPFYVTFPATAT